MFSFHNVVFSNIGGFLDDENVIFNTIVKNWAYFQRG